MKKIPLGTIAVTPAALLREINASEDEELEALLKTEPLLELKDTAAVISLRGLDNYHKLIDDILDEPEAKQSELSDAIYISTIRGYTLRFLRDEYMQLGARINGMVWSTTPDSTDAFPLDVGPLE